MINVLNYHKDHKDHLYDLNLKKLILIFLN